MDFQQIVDAVLSDADVYRGHGTPAAYIPALKQVDPRKLGIAVVLGDGSSYVAGDADEAFSIQSISKVFTLSMALQRVGPLLWNRVGREPSGSPFNSIVQLEEERGKPRNPLINAGAFVVTDQLIEADANHENANHADRGEAAADDAVARLLEFLQERSGAEAIAIDRTVAISESQAGALNRSLAHFVAAHGNMDNPVETVLSVYFRQCAIAMSCRQLARAALYLAFDGTDPVTGDVIVASNRSRRINAIMLTCGHYDNSGDFAFRVGLPGKSGVGGGIIAVSPGHGAVCVWSPGLNAAGTSLAGAVALEKLVERTGWSVFA